MFATFTPVIDSGVKVSLINELQTFDRSPNGLAAAKDDLRRIWSTNVNLWALDPGYNDESVKAMSGWNRKDWKRRWINSLLQGLIERYNGKYGEYFEVAITTHTSVWNAVFYNTTWGMSIPSVDVS